MKKITLLVDEKWLEAITKLTSDVYEGETCTWVSVEEVKRVKNEEEIRAEIKAILKDIEQFNGDTELQAHLTAVLWGFRWVLGEEDNSPWGAVKE